MILATTSSLPGKKYQVIDVISSFAQCDASAANVANSANLLNKCIQEARDLLKQRATELKANAIIGIQSSFSELKNMAIYHMQGTAVVYVDLPAKNAATSASVSRTATSAATTGGSNKQNRKKKNKNANRNKKHQKDQVNKNQNQNTRTGGKLSLKEIIENKIKEKEMKKKNKKNRQNKQNQLKTSFANQNIAKKSPTIASIQQNAQSFKTVKIVRTV